MPAPVLKSICFIAIIVLVTAKSGLYCQTAFNPDSLQQVLNSGAPENEKHEALLELAEGFLKTNPDQSLQYIDMLLESARKSGNYEALIVSYGMKGRIYLEKESYDTSVIYCDSGIILAASKNDPAKQAELNITRGNALYYSQGPESGIAPYKESFKLYADMDDSSGMSKALNGLGVMYKKMSQHDSALICYLNLVTIAERKGYENTLGLGYLNLGILYQDLLQLEKASHYLDLSIPINEKYRPDLVGLAYMNMGLINYEKQEFDTALYKLRTALDIYISLDDRKYIADVYNNIGNVYLESGNLVSADYFYTEAKEIYEQLANWYSFGQVYNNLALVNINRGNFNLALNILDSCLSLAVANKNMELEALVYFNKYYAYSGKHDYQKALENYLIHDSLQEIIYNLDKDERMADLDMKYQNEKKQAHILELERNNLQKDLDIHIRTKQRDIFMFTGIGIIALIIFGFLYFRQRAVKDRVISQQRIRQLEEEKKLLAAKSLVEGQEEERKRIASELHDGLGVLLSTTKMQFSTIHDKSPENQQIIEKAAKLLEQATSDVRKISHNMMPGLLTKLGLFEAVTDLFEKLSETEGIHVLSYFPQAAERMPENKEIMVYRIIQELVNNTLKHADAKNIEIQMQLLPGYLDIIYSDDGKGFIVEDKLGSKSLGLTSIQSRVNFLNGNMQVHSAPGKGVMYKFEIPK